MQSSEVAEEIERIKLFCEEELLEIKEDDSGVNQKSFLDFFCFGLIRLFQSSLFLNQVFHSFIFHFIFGEKHLTI